MSRILLVEDNEMNREMLTRALTRAGYTVSTADDGAKAISVARAELPDLILMDLSIPEIDGWEASSRLKADATTQHIPIIALTAHALASDRDRAIEAGCDDYDTKPVDIPALIAKIRSLLTIAD